MNTSPSGASDEEDPLSALWDAAALIGEFRDEARGELAALDAALLAIERSGDLPDEERATLLRLLHTLKGNAGMIGLSAIRDYVHALEDRFRTPPSSWTPTLLDRLFEGAAALRTAISEATTAREAAAFARLEELHPSVGNDEHGDAAPAAPAPRPVEPPMPVLVGGGDEMVRVPWAKLDRLLAQVAEVASVGAALAALEAQHRSGLRTLGARGPLVDQVQRLDGVAAELRSSVMELRLVPLGQVLARFPSLVRDLARDTGKQVRLEIEGEETELDKSTVDSIAEPLLHLIRNAVDHGAELPERRLAAGKPAENRIRIAAERDGDRVRLVVEDDGSGLDRAAIRERAISRGLRGADAAEDPAEMIFRAGFSTRDEANATSGRGLGLDIVRRAVQELRGTLAVDDAPGGGTRFTLELPLTVALVPVVLVEATGEMLALPSADVEEVVRRGRAEQVGAAQVVRRGERTVPLAWPGRLLGWEQTDTGGYLAIVRRGRRTAALVVDRVIIQRTVLVRALPGRLAGAPGVSGATVNPDGRVVLLLDVDGLLAIHAQPFREELRAG